MNKYTKDKITGVGTLLFGLTMLWYIIPNWVVMKTANLNHTSPDTFPRFASWVLVLLGAFLLGQAFYNERLQKHGDGTEQEAATKKDERTFGEKFKAFISSDTYCVLMTAFTILLFDFLLTRIGYIKTGCICSVLLLVAFRSKKWYHYVIVIAFTFFLYYLFSKVLLVKMP